MAGLLAAVFVLIQQIRHVQTSMGPEPVFTGDKQAFKKNQKEMVGEMGGTRFRLIEHVE